MTCNSPTKTRRLLLSQKNRASGKNGENGENRVAELFLRGSEEIEVDSLVGLQHRAMEQAGVAAVAAGVRRRRNPRFLAFFQLFDGHQQLELAVGHVERDAVAGLDQR